MRTTSLLLLALASPACTADEAAPADTHHDALAHCRTGAPYPVDPRDATMRADPVRIVVNAATPDTGWDLQIPDAMADWLYEQGWPQQHDDWHNIRRWDSGCRRSNAPVEGCASAGRLVARGLWRAAVQEGAPGDGYAFLVMHRHMIRGIAQAFPRHASALRGFSHVPLSREDPENPLTWKTVSWSEPQRRAIDVLEHVEDHLDMFPTEDDLGLYIEAPFRWTTTNPQTFLADSSNGLHFVLHSQWSVAGSPYNLGEGPVTVFNHTFWRLHGWIDDVWERYRRAKHIGDDDPRYVSELRAQCEEMHMLDEGNLHPTPSIATPAETTRFATQVQPIFTAHCAGCHSATGATAGLTLGGTTVAPSEVRRNLVGVRSTQVPSVSLVEAGHPEQSWLLRKVSGDFAGVTCNGCRSTMPPAGTRLTAAEIDTLRSWIQDGAPAE
jgi:mono/diheme cytochrome c family protein